MPASICIYIKVVDNMKVLMLSSYFYCKEHPEFERNKTGFGLLIPEIATSVGSNHDVSIDTYIMTEGFLLSTHLGTCNVLKHTKKMILKYIRLRDLFSVCRLFDFGTSFRNRIHNIYYEINTGCIKRNLLTENPDIVHIHDIQMPFIKACESAGIPYIVTLHGLNGFLDSVDKKKKTDEKEFLQRAYKDGILVTVISTGIKRRIEKEYLNGMVADNIVVVTNGTNVNRIKNDDIIQNEEDIKIITVIGNICERKNQLQIVEAARLLGDRLDGFQIHFCGNDTMGGQLQELVSKYGLEDKILFRGFLSPEDIDNLLDMAALNIVASTDEGFGLSMIEAFVHGVPTLTFADLDAVPDLYDEKAMLLCHERTTEKFAEAMEAALKKEWNRDEIIKYSNKFSLQTMASDYVSQYEKVLNK